MNCAQHVITASSWCLFSYELMDQELQELKQEKQQLQQRCEQQEQALQEMGLHLSQSVH